MKLARRDALIGLGLALATGGGARSLLACRHDDDDAGPEPPNRGQILNDLTKSIIQTTYANAGASASSLEGSLTALRDGPSLTLLTGARESWRKARSDWKVSDAFLFGPADDLEITSGAIDTQADVAKIEETVSASTPLDAVAVAKLGANQRGFGAIEALLFDPARDDAAMLATFGAAGSRRAEFAALLGTELKSKIAAVSDAWSNGYANELITAGRGSKTYAMEHQGIDIVVNGLVSAAEVVITLHLAQPLGIDKDGAPKPELVESPRADASIDDILAVLKGIEGIYLGALYGYSGLPLAAAVADRNATADTDTKSMLTKAKAAVAAIPGPLRTAVVMRRDPVMAAYNACHDLKRALAIEVAGALGTSLGFTVTDGD